MIELARPWVLGLLPFLLGWWLWSPARRRLALPQFLGEHGEGRKTDGVLPSLPALLRLVTLSLLVLALAGPRSLAPLPLPPQEGVAIMIGLDLSGSMALDDRGSGSRLDMARNGISRLVLARPQDRIGLVTFGSKALTRVPPATSQRHLLEVLAGLRIPDLNEGTALGVGLGLAANGTLSVDSRSRVVIVITDGRNNSGNLDPLSAAEAAGVLGIKIYTVGVGPERGEDPLDEPLLRAVAELGKGRYFRAEDPQGLREVLEALDTLETGPVAQRTGYPVHSHHAGILLAALLLLCLGFLLPATPWGRVP